MIIHSVNLCIYGRKTLATKTLLNLQQLNYLLLHILTSKWVSWVKIVHQGMRGALQKTLPLTAYIFLRTKIS